MTVFISRTISDTSIFKTILNPAGYAVVGQSLVNFTPVSFDKLPQTDWLFFYSKRGVQFFFEQLEHQLAPTIKLAAIGPATAEKIKYYNYQVNFIGDGAPESTAQKFTSSILSDQTTDQVVIFPQAKNSRRSIQQLMKNQVQTIDLIVYDNQIVEDVKLPYSDILVFTSPLNVIGYLESNQILESQQLVAIGLTTALFLKQKGYKAVHIADMPSEKSMAEKVLEIS